MYEGPVGLVRLRASHRLVECVAAAPDHLDTYLAATLLGQFLCVEIQASHVVNERATPREKQGARVLEDRS
jgi:hypothetical protein